MLISLSQIFHILSKTILSFSRELVDHDKLQNIFYAVESLCVHGPTLARLATVSLWLSIGKSPALRVTNKLGHLGTGFEAEINLLEPFLKLPSLLRCRHLQKHLVHNKPSSMHAPNLARWAVVVVCRASDKPSTRFPLGNCKKNTPSSTRSRW